MRLALAAVIPLSLLTLVISPIYLLGYIGMVICFVLSALGTAEGIYMISKFVSGASIKVPAIGTKSVLGTVVCEANFLTGIIMCVMLNSALHMDTPAKAHYLYFSSGLFVGLCNYYSSIATGMVCAVISMADAKHPFLFFKLVVLEIIPASVGLIGFIIGIVLNSKLGDFAE